MPPFLWPEQILANNTKTTPLGCIRCKMDERNNPCTPEIPTLMLSTYSQAHVRKNPQQTWDFTLLIATQNFLFCFVILARARIETSLPDTTSRCCTTCTIKTTS